MAITVNSLICENLNLESGSVPNCRGIEIVIFVILNLESGRLFLHEIGNVQHCCVMNEVGFRSPELGLAFLLIFGDVHVLFNGISRFSTILTVFLLVLRILLILRLRESGFCPAIEVPLFVILNSDSTWPQNQQNPQNQ